MNKADLIFLFSATEVKDNISIEFTYRYGDENNNFIEKYLEKSFEESIKNDCELCACTHDQYGYGEQEILGLATRFLRKRNVSVNSIKVVRCQTLKIHRLV